MKGNEDDDGDDGEGRGGGERGGWNCDGGTERKKKMTDSVRVDRNSQRKKSLVGTERGGESRGSILSF